MKFPVKVTYPGSEKTLTARDQKELDALLRIGWKVKE
jgi:hypothetical protein